MLKELGSYFDHYTINARFKPVFLSTLPFVLTMLAWCPISKSLLGGTLTVLISFGVMTFISTLISNLGNKCQDKLFSIWAGAPTTIILRHSDNTIDKYTKRRYHKWLSGKLDGLKLPNTEEEKYDPEDADSRYKSAINFLREFTRDKEKYLAVYRDNVNYGFSRNLLAIRNFGLSISLLCVLANLYFLWPQLGYYQNGADTVGLKVNFFGVGAGFASIIFLVSFLFIVSSKFVMDRGFRYAKTLLESCELKQ